MNRLIAVLLAAFSMAAPSSSQELPTPFEVIGTGDPGAAGEPIALVIRSSVNRARDLAVSTSGAVTSAVSSSINGRRVFTAGDPLGGTGFFVGSESPSICVGTDGAIWAAVSGVNPGVPSMSAPRFLCRGREVVIAEGQPCLAPGVAPGTHYGPITQFIVAESSSCIFYALLESGGASDFAILRASVDPAGTLVGEEVLAREGTSLPGFAGTVDPLLGGVVRPTGASFLAGFDPVLTYVFNGQEIVRPGDPAPFAGRTWASFSGGVVNDDGDWAMGGRLDDGKWAIIKNGEAFMHEDDLPEEVGTSSEPLFDMGPRQISSRGRLIWATRQTPQGALTITTTFVEKRLMMRDGEIAFAGQLVSGALRSCSVDPDGVNATISSGAVIGSSVLSYAIAVPLDQADPVCGNPPTSAGADPIVSVHGSPWLADGTDFEILTRRLPQQTFALSLVSGTPAPATPVSGAIGDLCLGGTIFRSPILRSNGLGTTRAWLSDVPIPSSLGPSVGETWRFQTWYRDVDTMSGAPVSRFTEAVEMPFL